MDVATHVNECVLCHKNNVRMFVSSSRPIKLWNVGPRSCVACVAEMCSAKLLTVASPLPLTIVAASLKERTVFASETEFEGWAHNHPPTEWRYGVYKHGQMPLVLQNCWKRNKVPPAPVDPAFQEALMDDPAAWLDILEITAHDTTLAEKRAITWECENILWVKSPQTVHDLLRNISTAQIVLLASKDPPAMDLAIDFDKFYTMHKKPLVY